MNDASLSSTVDRGAWCLALALQMLGIAADPMQIKHQSGTRTAGMSVIDLVREARQFPVKARAVSSSIKRLRNTPVPVIAAMVDGHYLVIGRVTEAGLLVQGASDTRPNVMAWDDFQQAWTGQLILLSRRAKLTDLHRRFDLSWFWGAIYKYRSTLYEVLIGSFFIQILTLISPMAFQVVIDKVLVHHSISTLEVMVAGLAIAALFEVVLTGLRTYIFSHTSNRIDVELGARIFKHLIQLPLAYFQARRVGDSVVRVRELENIRQFLTGSSLTLVIDLVFGTIFITIMFVYSPALGAIILATLPIYGITAAVVTPIFNIRLQEKFRRGAENQAFLVESVSGIETIKSMAVEPMMQREWEEKLALYVGASFKAQYLSIISNQIITFISKFVNIICLFIGARLVIDGELTVGELVAFNMLAGQVSGPVIRLAQLWQDFNQAKISVDRIGDILNTLPEASSSSHDNSGGAIAGNIDLVNVTFRYRPDMQPVLKGLNLRIRSGEVIGIVGQSGSGKSTITKLIQRLYVPEQGQVLIDGQDAALCDPAWLRRQIGVVLQENILFNRSIRDNIALINPALQMSEIIAAATLAGAHDFIVKMPQGYDTVLGERGSSLSGGQRQRIAIARALLGNPRILIFDEATSALDYESESIIQKNMKSIVAGRTVIIIAHRLSTVRNADRIITIEEGLIVEEGTHDRLIAAGGRYAMLHKIQTAIGS